jgi:branched-chain amino acid transport system ATP-binding protein
MLDEPSAGLAPQLKSTILRAIVDIKREGTSVLLVEQDASSALRIVDRIYLLERGHIVRDGMSQEFFDDIEVRRRYLGL